ncbi:MAG: hypothetical protein M3Y29_01070, partial [Chloroflexota bacterium]|nr:hypothetical protein [Chloroflexota bacterium]
TEPGSVHFGGTAAFGDGPGRHAFRVDVHAQPGNRPRQQLTMSLYAPGAVPGRDSPVHRVSGPIRPGRVDLAALPAGGGPGG